MRNLKDESFVKSVEAVREITLGKTLFYHITTFGCQQNEADSEKLSGLCEAMGYLPAQHPEDASLILVNTCAIRHHAEDRAFSFIGTLKALKKKNPDIMIGICGCMAAEEEVVTLLKRDFHYVSFTLAPSMLVRLPELVLSVLKEQKRKFLNDTESPMIAENVPTVRRSKHSAWVSIMYGCNNFCSYCIVPYVRGRERSRPSDAILRECRELVDSGIKEITLLGQNVNSYRSDLDFPALLEAVAAIEGDFWVRFMTSHPKDLSDELIATMARHTDKICPVFHLPLQSGSDRILKLMNRTYDSAHYLELIQKLRSAIPNIAITTDVIVAFPSETEEDFEKSYDIVRTVGFDKLFAFIYSPRSGTRAATLPYDITEEEKRDRMARLLAVQNKEAEQKNLPYLDRCERVLVESDAREGENRFLGRTSTNKLVHITSEKKDIIGQFVTVRITKTTPYDLFGTIIHEKNEKRISK